MQNTPQGREMSQTVFITGSNRGLGLEFVRQYLAQGWRVIASCRAPLAAEDLQSLFTPQNAGDDGVVLPPPDLQLLALDVADFSQINNLPDALSAERIDLVIHNAGIYGGEEQMLGSLDVEMWKKILEINTIAPAKITEALMPVLRDGAAIAFVTSLMGSITDNSAGGAYLYRSSKAALNAVGKSLAIDLAGRFPVVLLHPGWVKTRMGGPNGLIDVQTSVEGMRSIIEQLSNENSGRFIRFDGKELPW